MNRFKLAKKIFTCCLEKRYRLLGEILLIVFAYNLIDITGPKLLQLFIDSIDNNPLQILGFDFSTIVLPQTRIYYFPVALLLLAIFRWGCSYLRVVRQARLGQGALYDLRSRIYDQIQSLSFSYHDRTHSGRLIANIVEDVGHISQFFQRSFFPLFELLMALVCIYVYMFIICWPAAMVSLGLMSLAVIGGWLYFCYAYSYFKQTRGLLEDTVSFFADNIEGQLVVRACGREAEQGSKYFKLVHRLHNAMLCENCLFSLLNQLYILAVVFGITAVLAVAIYLRQHGWDLTTGKLFLLFFLQSLMIFRMRWLSRITDHWMRFTVASEKLAELFFANDYLETVGSLSMKTDSGCGSSASVSRETGTEKGLSDGDKEISGDIEVRDLSFAYRQGANSLTNINLRIGEGQHIGLIGACGSGKTTLALLLSRFYDPLKGKIFIGNTNIKDIDLALLRRQFALVFQDSFLFSASISENIAYGKPGANAAEIVNAATLSQAHDFIMGFPEQYKTIVGERGVTLSGGQRQRLSIARALLRKPRFLIFDAATSAVDSSTEAAMQESCKCLPTSTTIITIAHRYSSIAEADYIYVLEQGRIIETGTPRELNRAGSAFNKILQRQDRKQA